MAGARYTCCEQTRVIFLSLVGVASEAALKNAPIGCRGKCS